MTDKELRIMLSKGDFEQAYNAQLAVDLESGCILSAHVTNHPTDIYQLDPAVERLAELPEELGRVKALMADTGYYSGDNVKSCVEAGITPYIATKRQKHNHTLEKRFGITDEPDEPLPDEDEDPVGAMKHRLATKEGRALYARRKSTVEPIFGVINQSSASGNLCFATSKTCKPNGSWSVWR